MTLLSSYHTATNSRSSHWRGLVAFGLIALTGTGCSDPECPPGRIRVGKTCYPIAQAPDGGSLPMGEEREVDDAPSNERGRDGGLLADDDPDSGPPGLTEEPDTTDAATRGEDSTSQDAAASIADAAVQDAAARDADAVSQDAAGRASADAATTQAPDAGPKCEPAPELCGDGKDNDCDGIVDNAITWFRDCDNDGYATLTGSITACAQPKDPSCTYVKSANPPDCDDASASRHPGAKPLITASSPISTLYLGSYDDDTNCDGVFEQLSTDFVEDGSSDHISGISIVVCTTSNKCAGGKACYSVFDKPEGTVATCGNTHVEVSLGGGPTACITQEGTLRVICQ